MADTAVSTREKDQIAAQCRAEYQAGLLYRHDREKAWQLIEQFYFNKTTKSLKGKFNVPVPIIPGFVDTWQAKLSKPVPLSFDQGADSADYRAAKKATAFYQKIKANEDYDWDMLETDGTKLAGIYGRTIYKKYAMSKGGFQDVLELVDPYDFDTDPLGGGVDERAKYKGQDNIFRSREELKDGVESGMYDAGQVTKLINATKSDKLVDNDTQFKSKQNRLIALGLDGITHNYAGQDLYKLQERGTTWKGKRYYIVMNYETGIWVTCVPWIERFKSNLWLWPSWATNRDTFNFWSKSPCDDMLPLAEVIRVLINQHLDNRNKINYGQRGYDPAIIPDPSQLEWRQDGLVAFKAGSAQLLGDMKKGIFNFETPAMTGTIETAQFIDNMLKEKLGINSESQGSADTSKVGIAYLNVQQSAERTKLTYQSKTKCWVAIGRRFLWGLSEHMRSPEAVRIIGEKGYEEDKLHRFEINPKWDVTVSGGEDEKADDAIQKKQTLEAINNATPAELAVVSPKWLFKLRLQVANVAEDEQRLAFDLQDESNREILSRASKMIQDCLEGKPYKPYRGATTAFCQKILDFATEEDLPLEEYNKLMQIVAEHTEIAAENAARKAVKVMAQQGMAPGGMAQPGFTPEGSGTDTGTGYPAQTASQSQQLTSLAPAMGQNMQ